ncbi:NAD(P)/FAD-dependent oxidoreductase [Microbacterium sp. CJ77]|uniref:phytoene desaturase family protein n=1 Tax=Microbacterium sp. CJ77 TaxID=2079201 RepID=UPI000CD89D64|nr:NAD(P)/FAD-dependent oxidoreductase [Microbacterium sp. CJ77]
MTDHFDAVVVGGGHHATIIAPYLARAGLNVAVFEARTHLGGGAQSMPGPVGGVTQNPCAHWTRFYGHPAYRDFGLGELGLRYVFPEGNEAMVFDDGSVFIGYSAARVVDDSGRAEPWAEGVARTEANIRAFSRRDADAYLRIHDAYAAHIKSAFGRQRFTPPPPWGTPDPLEALLEAPGSLIEPVHQFMTMRQLAYDVFESDELRTLFMRAGVTSTGCYPDDVPGLQGFVHNLALVLSLEPAAIAIGGTGAITSALVKAGRMRGVRYFTGTRVDEIVQDGGRATGIRLEDGTFVGADVVVSDLGLPQTVLQLLRHGEVAERIRHRLRNVVYDRGQLVWANVVTHEAPDYAGTTGVGEAGSQPRLYWGPKDPDWFATRYQAHIFAEGISPRMLMLSSTDSQWDTTRAPDGLHITGIEEFTAPARFFDEAGWAHLEREFERRIRAQWPTYARNMTDDNIAAIEWFLPPRVRATHPDMIEGGYVEGAHLASQMGRFRPIPELADYRTLLPNLYNCSSNVHSGSGIGRGSSLNCWHRIAQDLGIDPDAEIRRPEPALLEANRAKI